MKQLSSALILAISVSLLFSSCDFAGTTAAASNIPANSIDAVKATGSKTTGGSATASNGSSAAANGTAATAAASAKTAGSNTGAIAPVTPIANSNAAAIMALPQIPILCYHQIRDYKATDSKSARDYIVPTADFKAQMKGLADSGYTTILPEDLYNYLNGSKTLPAKPVMLTFDDGCDEQFDITHDVLDPLKFKGAYFIMTVSVNRPNYMKADQIKQLADEGHSVGLHTWDHHNVKKYAGTDWETQISKPKLQLEKIIGKPIRFFAYPFGLWNPPAIPELKSRGLAAAFQLSTARDAQEPLYTIRRIIVPGGWSGAQLVSRMKGSFH